MFHEPYFYFTLARPWRNALAIVQRVMARVLLQAAGTVYLSTETWRRYLAPAASARVDVLPIPSSIPKRADAARVREYRRAVAPSREPVLRHFGTYGEHLPHQPPP